MSKDTLADMKRKLDEFNARWVADGGALATWGCADCEQINETPRPTAEQVGPKGYWDSLKTCVHCGAQSFVAVHPGGVTQVWEVPA